MKKNRSALILVLFVVISYPVFSDQETCRGTSEYLSGIEQAKMTSNAMKWGLLAFGLTSVGNSIGLYMLINSVSEEEFKEALWVYHLGTGAGIAISLGLPLAIKQEPNVIPMNLPEDKYKCYLKGYYRKARRKNVTGAILGSLIGLTVSGLAFGIYDMLTMEL